ncbi:hypothetical protein AB6A40_000696 [Gnathostoma spinigerum]|uniref:Uncharacterized protein n=1 Tax=Gnathostoma spinigerum TaxID=75299 RepID=A0ABD6EBW7_9BILA
MFTGMMSSVEAQLLLRMNLRCQQVSLRANIRRKGWMESRTNPRSVSLYRNTLCALWRLQIVTHRSVNWKNTELMVVLLSFYH